MFLTVIFVEKILWRSFVGCMKLVKTLSGHSSGIYKLLAEGNMLYSASGDGIVAAWDISTGEPASFSVKVGQPVFSMHFTKQHILVGQQAGGIHVIDRDGNREKRHLKLHEKGVFDIVYNPRANHYYTTGGGGSLSVVDADDFRLLMQIPVSGMKLRRILPDANFEHIYVSGSDGRITCFETDYMNEVFSHMAHEGGTYAMIWGEDGSLLTGGRDAHIRRWKADKSGLVETQSLPAHNYAIYDLVNMSSSRFASASRDKSVKVWNYSDIQNPERLHNDRPTAHTHSANALLWHNDRLFSGGDDRHIHIWAEV